MTDKIKQIYSKNKHVFYISWFILLMNLWFNVFLVDGTYFFLDTSFVPFTEFKNFFSQSLYRHLLDLLNAIIWYKSLSKLYIVWILLFCIYFWKIVSNFIQKGIYWKKPSKAIDIITIMVSVYNPFVYERLITQSWVVLWIYLLWLWLIYSLRYFEASKRKNLLASIVLFATWLSIFPHTIIFLGLIFFILICIHNKNIKKISYIWFWVFILNLNWLIGVFLLKNNPQLEYISWFNYQNLEAFSSNSISNLWVEITHLLWYGFWAEKYHIITPDKIFIYWYIAGFIVFLIVLYWLYKLYQINKKLTLSLWLISVLSYILSLWISSKYFLFFNNLLYDNFPYYMGMREPQKWIWIMIITYIFFYSVWTYNILNITKKQYKNVLIFILCITPIIWTPWSFFAYFNQIRMSDYPQEINTSKDFLIDQWISWEKIVSFPWHSYIACNWTQGIITSNKVDLLYYPIDIISSDNIEIWNLYTNSSNLVSKDVDNYLKKKDISLLKKNNISYVLMYNTCADFQSYWFLDESWDFSLIFDSKEVNIYKINYEK